MLKRYGNMASMIKGEMQDSAASLQLSALSFPASAAMQTGAHKKLKADGQC
jgi:hypothetical protein